MLMPGVNPVALARFNPMVPLPAPVLTVTVYVVPEPLRVLIPDPLTPVVVSEKLLAVNPVTDDAKVTVYCTEDALVGLDVTRLIEFMAIGAAIVVKFDTAP